MKKQLLLSFTIILLLLSSIVSQRLVAQNQAFTHQEKLIWSKQTTIDYKTNQSIETLIFEQAMLDYTDSFLPKYIHTFPIENEGTINVKLQNTQFEVVETNNIPEMEQLINENIVIETYISYEKKRPYANISFFPIQKNRLTGDYEKLTAFDLDINISPSLSNNYNKKKAHNYTDNSVLNQGTFYQFHVEKTGMHQLDFNFLEALGISETVDFNKVRIYGNGGGMLPNAAGVERYDDLLENAIQVNDANGNGVFEQGDFIIFYAEGPDTWKYDETENNPKFRHIKHLYSRTNSYFLNFDVGQGKRISDFASSETPNTTVNSFDDYAFHEENQESFNKSGQIWLGEVFTGDNNQVFSFNFPNIDTDAPAHLSTRVGANSSQVPTSFSITIDDSPLQNHNIGIVSGRYPDAARLSARQSSFATQSEQINVGVNYNRSDPTGLGWLDYIALNVRRKLDFANAQGQLLFRDVASFGEGKVADFQLLNASDGVQIWEVTRLDGLQQMRLQSSGSTKSFVANTSKVLREFIAFDGNSFYTPTAVGEVASQNLHAEIYPDLIIVTHPTLLEKATQLADFHRDTDGMLTQVVTVDQIYNEFSSGTADLTAIRNFVKMHYDRAGNDWSLMPENLLLFGDASYDYLNTEFDENLNTNLVPTYESEESTQTLVTFCSDDYFGFLDDTEGDSITLSRYRLDIGIGRLPVRTPNEAQGVLNKIYHYKSNQSLGDWRNNLTFVADDEDSNTHFNHAEGHISKVLPADNTYNVQKIYFDAYQQISTPGGGRYPAVNEAINSQVFAGTFVMNYVGHGGEKGWAHERVLSKSDIQKWTNIDKLPLFITATCSFSRYDDPEQVSAGEELLLNPNGGAIAIMTTVRLVFASSNRTLNSNFLERLFEKNSQGQHLTLGEVARLSKNDATSGSVSIGNNNRKFVLLGDPALTLNYPKYNIKTTHINQEPALPLNDTLNILSTDTLSALSKITIAGEVLDENNNRMSNFNGTVYPTVFDKKITLRTLGQDTNTSVNGGGPSYVDEFDVQKNIIFKGKTQATDGRFEFTFIVPKDISYQFGVGKISYYAENQEIDAKGVTDNIIIGGISDEADADNQAPEIEVFLNDEKFVFGGLTNPSPTLFVKLKDDNGINTVGNGIGHDITATLDDNTSNLLVLNQFYKAELGSYQAGEIRYPLSDLATGLHSVNIKAWDIHNNSAQAYTEFVVAENAEIALQNVLNYPNPFTEQTAFWFEHNRAGDKLTVMVQIHTVSGRLVKTIREEVLAEGFRVDNIVWDGLDDFGNKIAKGVYVYKLSVRSNNDLSQAHKVEKLVILK